MGNDDDKQNVELAKAKILLEITNKRLDGHSNSIEGLNRSIHGFNGTVGLVGIVAANSKSIRDVKSMLFKAVSMILVAIIINIVISVLKFSKVGG